MLMGGGEGGEKNFNTVKGEKCSCKWLPKPQAFVGGPSSTAVPPLCLQTLSTPHKPHMPGDPHTHTHTHICMHAHIHTHACMHTHTHTLTCVCTHTNTHTHTHTHTHTRTCMHTNTHMHACICTRTHTHTHTHICTCLLYTSPSPRDCIVSRMPSSA